MDRSVGNVLITTSIVVNLISSSDCLSCIAIVEYYTLLHEADTAMRFAYST